MREQGTQQARSQPDTKGVGLLARSYRQTFVRVQAVHALTMRKDITQQFTRREKKKRPPFSSFSLVRDAELLAGVLDDRGYLGVQHVRHGGEKVVLDLVVNPAHRLRHEGVAVAEIPAVSHLARGGGVVGRGGGRTLICCMP